MKTNEITKQIKREQEYVRIERTITDCKTEDELPGIYLAYWKLSRLRLYARGVKDLLEKDKLRKRLLEKMRVVL